MRLRRVYADGRSSCVDGLPAVVLEHIASASVDLNVNDRVTSGLEGEIAELVERILTRGWRVPEIVLARVRFAQPDEGGVTSQLWQVSSEDDSHALNGNDLFGPERGYVEDRDSRPNAADECRSHQWRQRTHHFPPPPAGGRLGTDAAEHSTRGAG